MPKSRGFATLSVWKFLGARTYTVRNTRRSASPAKLETRFGAHLPSPDKADHIYIMVKISRRIKLMYDAPKETIPADVLAALTSEERDAFFNHHEYFVRLAANAVNPDIKRYLERIAKQDIFWTILFSEEEAPYRVYFHHTVLEAGESFRIRLPNFTGILPGLPKQLQPVYGTLGGLRQEHGGLICPEDIQAVESGDFWLSEENDLDPSACFLFYDFGNGDSFGYTSSGGGVMYDHENGLLIPASLEEFTSECFKMLLAPRD